LEMKFDPFTIFLSKLNFVKSRVLSSTSIGQ
jgi:hypothetical protein